MASTDVRPPPARTPAPKRSVFVGPLLLAATLFVATICAGFTILWLLDRSSDPGPWTVVVAVAAIVATIVSAYADNTWSARVTRTTELGNATRLLAVATVLLLIPTVILQVVAEDDTGGLTARGTAAACPEGQVPETTFEDLPAGSSLQQVASCLQWWGVLAPETTVFAGADTVLRAEMATLLDRLVAAGGAPLPEAPDVVPPDPTSPHAGAIARVSAAGLLGTDGDVAAFAPGVTVTRGELSAAVARAHQHVTGAALPAPEEGTELFTDIEDSPHADAIEAVAAAGIAVGTDEGTFVPAAAVNRRQVATILARTLDLWVTQGVTQLPA